MSPNHDRPQPASTSVSVPNLLSSSLPNASLSYAPAASAPFALPPSPPGIDFGSATDTSLSDAALQKHSQEIARLSDRPAAINAQLDALQRNLDRVVANLPADTASLEALGLRSSSRAGGSAAPLASGVEQSAGEHGWDQALDSGNGYGDLGDFDVEDFLSKFGAFGSDI
jgi:hypothetical protein